MSSTKDKIEKIEKQHLILCEGEDEFWFLVSLLNSSELRENPFFANDIQIFNFGGNEELPKKLSVLRLTSGFQQVQSLLILRDTERDAQAAVRGGFVVVRAGADQFLRFVLLHVAYQIYTFCQSDLLFGYSLAHDDSSFSASSVSASRGVWGEYGCGTFPQIGTLPPLCF